MGSKRRDILVSTLEKVGITLVVAVALWGVGIEAAESASGMTSSVSDLSSAPSSQTSASSSSSSAASKKAPVIVSSSSASSSSKASSSSSAASAKPSVGDNAEASQTTLDDQVVDGGQDVDEAAVGYVDVEQETENASNDKAQPKKRRTSKGSQAQPSASNQSDSNAQPEQNRVWVEPVYEDVYHEEQGHWETRTRTVTKYYCGGTDHNPGDPNYDGPFGGPSPIFDDYDGWVAHQEAFIAEMRKDDPYYVCTGRHRPALEMPVEEEYEEYVVDEAAWTEQVLISEGHWEYR